MNDKMSEQDIKKLFDEAKCSSENANCDHNCSTCGINTSEPGLWKVYLGLAGAIVVLAIAASYLPKLFSMILG